MDPLFPPLPENLAEVPPEELEELKTSHEEAARLIREDNEDFLKGLTAEEIIEQLKVGAEQMQALKAEVELRAEAHENFVTAKDDLLVAFETPKAEDEPAPDDPSEPDPEDEGEVAEVVEERELVLASAEAEEVEEPAAPVRLARKPPAPAPERIVVNEEPEKPALSFVASGLLPTTPPGAPLKSKDDLALAIASMSKALGKPSKHEGGREDKYLVASLDYSPIFPDERQLHAKDWQANGEKIAKAVGSPFFGKDGMETLLASGGLCAPLEPIYSMPQLATDATPVEDAIPFMRAERGGINVPTPTTIGDAAEAITTIEEADDALGGTFATKACLDLTCPAYTETAVTIISACREFGNLNAMAWPEKIRHEVELTRAQHARTSETYLLEQIKALSINVTSGAETASALAYIVDTARRSMWGIRGRLRLPRSARFVALLPALVEDLLVVDTIFSNDGNRFTTLDALNGYLRAIGIDPVYYLDGNFAAGDDMIPTADEAANGLDDFVDTVQWALFPQGTFLGIDMAELNLGIVRDSTLNGTNDFQIFWERFLNVARVGPAQAAHWHTTSICPNGMLAPAGTARTCA